MKGPGGLKLMGGISAHMIKAMKERAEKLGVQIHYATAVQQILKNGVRVTGVITRDKGGSLIEMGAKAVVIAAGGYVHNRRMMEKYGGFELGRDFNIMHNVQLTGEGIRMAWAPGPFPTACTCSSQASTRARAVNSGDEVRPPPHEHHHGR